MIVLLLVVIVFLGLFLLGVKPATLLILIVALSLISLLFCTVFFLISAIILIFGKKSSGEFLHVETNGSRAYAWYRIEETDKYDNILERTRGVNDAAKQGMEKAASFSGYSAEPFKHHSNYSDVEMMMEINGWARTQAIKHQVISPQQRRAREKADPQGEVRALFPTDTIIQDKFYHEGLTKLSLLQLGRKTYALDGSTKLIIYLGLPLFSFLFILLGILFLGLF